MTQSLLPLTTSLQGQVALVTGGAVRVGRVISLALAGRGANIVFTYLPGEPHEATVTEIVALGVEALERFVRREPLRRVHECVLGVLAFESEPVDPRL